MNPPHEWTKDELLDQAKKEGIRLSKDTLDKYIGYGLFAGTSHSNGRGNGRAPSTYFRGMDSLRLIKGWKNTYRYKYKSMVVLLYWRGLPVDYAVLYTQLQQYHESLKTTFRQAPDYLESGKSSLEDDIREQLLPEFSQSRSGPLDQERKQQYKAAVSRHVTSLLHLMHAVTLMLKHGRLTTEVIEAFARFHEPDPNQGVSLPATPELLAMPYFHPDTWKERMEPRDDPEANEQHRQAMSDHLAELIAILQVYMQLLLDSPLAKTPLFQMGRTLVSELGVTDSLGLLLPALYGLVVSGYSVKLVELLQRPESQEAWRDLLQASEKDWIATNPVLTRLRGGEPNESTDR